MRRVARLLVLVGVVLPSVAGVGEAQADAPTSGLPALARLDGETSRTSGGADVAVNAAGQAVAAWAEVPVDQPGQPKSTGAMVSFRTAAGAWSPPARVSSPDYNAASVRAAIDASGAATIAWTEAPDYDREVAHVVRHTDAGFADPQSFTPPAGGANALDLAVNARGDAVLVWTGYDPCDGGCNGGRLATGDIWTATRTAGGAFGAAERVSDPASAYRAKPAVSVGADGTAAVAWEEGSTSDLHVLVRRRAAGGAFAASVDLPVGAVASSVPSVVVAPDGGTTVTWWKDRSMQATRIGADGAVVSTQTLGGLYATEFSFGRAALAVDDAGRVTAAWLANDGVWSATAAAGADLGRAVSLDRFANPSAGVALAVDPTGGAVVAWVTDQALRAAWRPVGDPAFRAAATIGGSTYAGRPQAALAGGTLVLTVSLGTAYDATHAFVTAGAPSLVAPPVPAAPVVPDTTAPTFVITSASVVRKRTTKRSGKRATSKVLQVVVRSSEPASAAVALTQRRSGIRRGRSCVARPAHRSSRKKAKSCRRLVTVVRPVRVTLAAGVTTLQLGAAPKRGAYDVTLTGCDTAGNVATAPSRHLAIR